MQRHEPELSLLLTQNKIDLKTKTPPVLSLAVGWTTGMQILLDAGANPDDAISTAIWEEHLPSIELLIDEGCSFFEPNPYSPFDGQVNQDLFDLAQRTAASSNVIYLLVQKLVERRLELLQLAWKELPEVCLKRLGLHEHKHAKPSPDFNALEVFKQLEAHKVRVPRTLWPGSFTSLYHHRGMTCTLADKLYDVGFCNIDEPDGNGRSPLINTLFNFLPSSSPRLAQWYLRKGSRLPRSLAYVSFLERAEDFTASIAVRIWISEDSKLLGALKMFQQLHPEGIEQRDSCSCWCSTSGCSPVGIVLTSKSLFWTYEFKPIRRRRWLFNMARYSSLGLSLGRDTFADICRLEIFDRLGMAHTCSRDQHDEDDGDGSDTADDSSNRDDGGDDNSDEQGELQEEDLHLKQALDSYVELYLCLLDTHADRFESFWIAWWIALECFLPFDTDNIYHCSRPLELDSLCDPQSYGKAQGYDSYAANVETITAFLTDCVPQLSPEARTGFLDQLEPTEDEVHEYFQWFLDDDWMDNISGTRHGND